ncbi:uncharacterized protein F4812DRAFT_188709 [Daldinia caldariorum]|uniref:uncharacterized protein n=1 Tax=Daldinia caldariorum TaxID=326644 RepID=UPI0020074C6B|nr:uncharacterized protein F4812DRAFT_188709 [Daldinia caldariorum]KAI1471691.1 hypothetical protein F4812DRAFT_188709 [Daldinia caldariorum]
MPTEQEKRRAALASRGRVPMFPPPPASPRGNGAQASPSTSASKTTPKTSETRSGRTGSPTGQLQHGQPLEAASILSHPRLQQVTGLHPRKLGWWKGVHPPRDELERLKWVMSLPDTYPIKRPKGNF